MSNQPREVSSGPTILGMAAPLVVSFWMRAAVTFVDTIYAALIGDASVASIGLAVPFEFLMIALWVGLSTGLTSGLSRAMGARDGVRIEQYMRSSWILVGVLGPLFTLVGAAIWVAAPRVGLDAPTARAFQIYGTVLIGGSAFTSFWSIIPDSIVKAHQDTRSTMWAGIWTNVLNLGMNTLFLFVFHWGVFGIALSTVLARVGGLVYALSRARRHEQRRKAEWEPQGGSADPAPYRTILALAIPSSLTFTLMALESGLVNGLLARTSHATESIAAYSIYYRVALFALQPVIAIAVAMLPFAASRIGGDAIGEVRRGVRDATRAAMLYSVAVVGPVLWFLAPWLALRLSESQFTLDYTRFALRTVPLSCLVGSPFLICRPVFEAMNRGRPGLLMACLRYLILTGPLAWLGLQTAARMGFPPLHGLIVGLLVSAAIPSVLFYLWVQAALTHVAGRSQHDPTNRSRASRR
jgi:Na+-driven multidrug efflux pump